ncbi:MAG: 6-phosphogluconolactonase [Actinomyces sp.]|uniref:6-phosphogluconolactonase n=1 Tax=Actinomyces sp. TaxID=29317 RepID=UPI0026DAE9E0|nr:6-phosphogluconolactonase [Actinomyces sp.]MDO4243330.1 6-phosphogluconolactonase [Actinomyces sp.]
MSRPAAHEDSARTAIEAGAAALQDPRVLVHTTLQDAAERAGQDTAVALAAAVAERGSAHLVLTGGSGGQALAEVLPAALEHAGLRPGAGLEEIHLWFGDERFVERGHADRNDALAQPLVAAGVPEARLHRVPGPEEVADVQAAAQALRAELERHGPADGRFDVIHLGLGPDAHVCSLFPGHDAALATGTTVAVRHSPKPPPERVSLTFEVIQRGREVMVVAASAGKAQAAALGLGRPEVLTAPASCGRGERTTWYLDAPAASALSPVSS